MRPIKIISGGQTGADQGGLIAAEQCRIKTGGWAPRGFKTESGPMQFLLEKRFGLRQTNDYEYSVRTKLNVEDSDATVLFMEVESKGSMLTIDECKKQHKPVFIVDKYDRRTIIRFMLWLENKHVVILNIAGNRESVSPGIEKRVTAFLTTAFGSKKIPKYVGDKK